MLEKTYIWLFMSNDSHSILDELSSNISRDLLWIIKKANKNHHITLDYLGSPYLEEAIKKLYMLSDLNSEIINSLNTLKIWSLKSFISNTSNERFFYLEIIWWELFFSYIKKLWYSIWDFPHITLAVSNWDIGEKKVNEITSYLNNKIDLIKKGLFLNLNEIVLSSKNNSRRKIIDILKIK